VVAHKRKPRLICSLDQRLRLIEAMGIRAAWLIRFDLGFSRQEAEPFIRSLVVDAGRLRGVCVGQDFRFGHRRAGDLRLLESLGRELGFAARGVPPVTMDGSPVNSTRIREAIQSGGLAAAARMLGRDYALAGPVIQGDGLGRRIGFPTANIDVDGLILPPAGVYVGWGRVGDKSYPAVANIGWRPTVTPEPRNIRVEVHLLDFAGELYDKEAGFSFRRRLRDEVRFASIEALRKQIEQDLLHARAILASPE
jgi:riboflavin kinase/FMN adenylyltransferase